ncbi:hypothetical protein QQP08_012734 [Theobroma cacao]|nr:hypothetical protein QQP08_012734 [Theobroma cacao]
MLVYKWRRVALFQALVPSKKILGPCFFPARTLPRFDCTIFMNSRTTGASTVSCKSGNKNDFFFWILFCLLPKFLGTPITYVNFVLIKAIDRSPVVVHP